MDSMKPIGGGHFLPRLTNSLPRRKNSLRRQKEFPAPTGEEIREFACNALELWHELSWVPPHWPEILQKLPAKFPASRECEHQARSCLRAKIGRMRNLAAVLVASAST